MPIEKEPKTDRQSCPLCGRDNGCQAATDPDNCWCHDVDIPKQLLDLVPDHLKRQSCICRSCIESFRIKRQTQ